MLASGSFRVGLAVLGVRTRTCFAFDPESVLWTSTTGHSTRTGLDEDAAKTHVVTVQESGVRLTCPGSFSCRPRTRVRCPQVGLLFEFCSGGHLLNFLDKHEAKKQKLRKHGVFTV